MLLRVIERPRSLEVLPAGDELAHGDIGCAKGAMRQAESGGVAVALGLSHEIRRRASIHKRRGTRRNRWRFPLFLGSLAIDVREFQIPDSLIEPLVECDRLRPRENRQGE